MKRDTDLPALDEARERAIAQLSDAFARDLVGLDELDRGLTRAHRADSVSAVERVVTDLVGPSATTLSERVDRVSAVFGGVERGGPWILPRRLEVTAFCGGIVLDLRDAQFSAGVTEVHVDAVMGGVQVIVPPGVSLEVAGTAFLGGFAQLDRQHRSDESRRPLVRICGRAVLGGVSVEVRLAGESEREAIRRRYSPPALGRGR